MSEAINPRQALAAAIAERDAGAVRLDNANRALGWGVAEALVSPDGSPVAEPLAYSIGLTIDQHHLEAAVATAAATVVREEASAQIGVLVAQRAALHRQLADIEATLAWWDLAIDPDNVLVTAPEPPTEMPVYSRWQAAFAALQRNAAAKV
jgi:hypothetical protein